MITGRAKMSIETHARKAHDRGTLAGELQVIRGCAKTSLRAALVSPFAALCKLAVVNRFRVFCLAPRGANIFLTFDRVTAGSLLGSVEFFTAKNPKTERGNGLRNASDGSGGNAQQLPEDTKKTPYSCHYVRAVRTLRSTPRARRTLAFYSLSPTFYFSRTRAVVVRLMSF